MQDSFDTMQVNIDPSWKEALQSQFDSSEFQSLAERVRDEYANGTIFPAGKNVFRAFDLCPFDKVKVVILGQDPYHGPGQAHGLSFSVPQGIPIPPSLRNIIKEQVSDLEVTPPAHGDLSSWATQGVLLLNATLTVREAQPASHQSIGWQGFTDSVIRKLSGQREGLVFLLWGSYARKKAAFIDPSRHLVLEAAHPSPLSAHRGFFGCRHFSKANAYLRSRNVEPIDWQL